MFRLSWQLAELLLTTLYPIPGLFSFIFVLFNNNFYRQIVDFSRNQTRIVRVAEEHSGHWTTTTTLNIFFSGNQYGKDEIKVEEMQDWSRWKICLFCYLNSRVCLNRQRRRRRWRGLLLAVAYLLPPSSAFCSQIFPV